MLLVLEAHGQRLEHAAPLHVDAFMTVDQDIVDAFVLEQRLERAEAGHFIENFRDEIGEFLGVQRQPLGHHIFRDQLLDVVTDFFFRQLFQRGKIDFLDQPAMQADLGVEQLVAEQRIGRRMRLHRRGLFGRHLGKRGQGRAGSRGRRRLFDYRRFWRGSASQGETAGHRLILFIARSKV